jgi:hypothetical protein
MSWRKVPIGTWIAMMLSVIAALTILRGFTGPIDSTHQSQSPYSVSTGIAGKFMPRAKRKGN